MRIVNLLIESIKFFDKLLVIEDKSVNWILLSSYLSMTHKELYLKYLLLIIYLFNDLENI